MTIHYRTTTRLLSSYYVYIACVSVVGFVVQKARKAKQNSQTPFLALPEKDTIRPLFSPYSFLERLADCITTSLWEFKAQK